MFKRHNFFFQFKNERVEFREGDFASYDTEAHTLIFLRGSERMYTESGDDKMCIREEDSNDIPSIIEIITGLTPMRRDENVDIVIYELM